MRGRVALVLVPVLDLLGAHYGLNPTAPVALFTHRPPLLDVMDPGRDHRVLAYDYFRPGASEHHLRRDVPYLPVRGPAGWPLPAIQALGLREYLYPPVAGAWKLAGSFDQDVSGFGPARVARLSAALYGAEARPDVVLRLLQLGAVTDVVALHERGWEPLLPAASVDGLFPEPLRLFRVPGTLPRAYLARGRAATDEADLRDLVSASFVPAQMVLIEGPLGPPLREDVGPSRETTPLGTARIVETTAEGVQIEVEAAEAAYVVMVDAYDPHWTATVDGHPVTVRRANTAFRAVAVGPGRHRVEMRYRPWPVFAGLGLTLAGAAVLAWRIAADARRRWGRS
jgi:hypothetical protein